MKWFVTDLIHIDLIYRIYIIQDLLKQFNPMFNFCCLKKNMHQARINDRGTFLKTTFFLIFIIEKITN